MAVHHSPGVCTPCFASKLLPTVLWSQLLWIISCLTLLPAHYKCNKYISKSLVRRSATCRGTAHSLLYWMTGEIAVWYTVQLFLHMIFNGIIWTFDIANYSKYPGSTVEEMVMTYCSIKTPWVMLTVRWQQHVNQAWNVSSQCWTHWWEAKKKKSFHFGQIMQQSPLLFKCRQCLCTMHRHTAKI